MTPLQTLAEQYFERVLPEAYVHTSQSTQKFYSHEQAQQLFLAGARAVLDHEALVDLREAMDQTIRHLSNLKVSHPHDCDLDGVLAAFDAFAKGTE